MLVITRKSGQSFTVANTEITVKLVGGKIKCYITGPDDVRRSELVPGDKRHDDISGHTDPNDDDTKSGDGAA